MRTILLAFAATAGLAAHAQTPQPYPFASYVEREGCQPEMFRTTMILAPVFPERQGDAALAICFFETPAQFPDGRTLTAKHQELRVVDPATLTELARHDVGCCSPKIAISIKIYADEAANPVKNNPRAMSDAIKALGVTRSANIFVDEDHGATGHEFRIQGGSWQRLFYH